MNALRPGDVLAGRYELIAEIRNGASAIVWHAFDSDTDASVALKFCAGADDGARRLEREYRQLARLDHPAVVRVLAAHTSADPPFIVLEHVDGRELRASMGSRPTRWIPELRSALDGLAHAHARGVAHGDLSLHNVIVGPGGRGRLVDFGSSRDSAASEDLRALGRLMHELATGLPLSHDGSLRLADRIPRELWRLIETLLDDSSQMTLAEVAATLDRFLSDKSGQRDGYETITPVGRDAARPVPRPQHTGPAAPRRVQLALASIGVAVLVAVALVLPRLFGTDERAGAETARDVGSTVTESAAAVRLAEQRQQVADLRAAVYAKWLELESMDVRTWAQLRAERAMERLSAGERMESAFETLEAIRQLRAADQLLQALLDEAPAIARFHREAGWQAYNAGDGDKAVGHFEIVLSIEPGAEDIRDAMTRARYLDQTAAMRRTANEQAAAGDLEAAVATLREALRIDEGNPDISAEVEHLENSIASRDFEQQMSETYRAMRAGRYAAARQALAKAATLRPDAAEVRDARTQLQVNEREAAVKRLKASAAEAEADQDWDAAIGLYSELLQTDPALVFAQQGRDRARLLASLTARTQAALETELTRDELRRQAEALIAQIEAVQADAPRLKALGFELAAALQRSREPVTVRLESDSQTEVTIFRVGRLGRFQQHELKLLPGRYTVLGTCDGFRDVRRELVVPAGEAPDPITIRCEERI